MRRSKEPRIASLLVSLLLAPSLLACWLLLATSASAQETPVVLWYRNGLGCPEGAAFLGRLGEDAARVRLAQAGDRVDFVLTIEQADARSTGRLERQTAQGTIAVSELKDASCEAVADGLALSLSLALQPGAAEPIESAPPPGEPTEPATSEPKREATPSAQAPAASSAETAPPSRPNDVNSRSKPTEVEPRPEGMGVRLGADGGFALGFLPGGSGKAGLYAELDRLGGGLPRDFAVKIGALGVVGATNTRAGRVTQLVLVERTAACPVRLGNTLSLSPCALLDLGVVGGGGAQATGVTDVGFWAAAGATLMLRWELGAPVALELDAAGVAPLTRYSVADRGGELYETSPVAFLGSIGISFRLQ